MKAQWLRLVVVAFVFCAAVPRLHAQALPIPVSAVDQSEPTALNLPAPLRAPWRATRLPQAALSLLVTEIRADGAAPLLAWQADTPRNPASVMKLVTTWLALSELGPEYVWRTELLTDPGARPDAQGALAAPIYLRAGGDPGLQIKDIWALLHELRLRGVGEFAELIVDRSLYADVAIDPGAFDGAATRPYNASPDALVTGWGAVRLLFVPDAQAQRWQVLIDPPLPGVTVSGAPQWRDGRCAGTPVLAVEALPEALPDQGAVVLRVSGEVAGSCGEFARYRLALDQAAFARAVLRYVWQSLGGKMKGAVRDGRVPGDAVLLAAHQSPPVAEIIRAVNKASNNLMARLLLLSLGVKQNSDSQRPVSLASSRQAAQAMLAAQGLSMPELVIDNGAGLSRTGRISADSLTRLLHRAWASPWMPEYVSSLAVLGVEGTFRRRLHKAPARGRAHLKSGSLRDARALAGYVHATSGKRYVVVSLVNHEQAQAAQAFEDALLAWLARQ